MAGELMDAPNQQAVRPDGSGPGIEASAAAEKSGPVERSLEQAGPPPPAPHHPRHRDTG
jgi:hypothetical protein